MKSNRFKQNIIHSENSFMFQNDLYLMWFMLNVWFIWFNVRSWKEGNEDGIFAYGGTLRVYYLNIVVKFK